MLKLLQKYQYINISFYLALSMYSIEILYKYCLPLRSIHGFIDLKIYIDLGQYMDL